MVSKQKISKKTSVARVEKKYSLDETAGPNQRISKSRIVAAKTE